MGKFKRVIAVYETFAIMALSGVAYSTSAERNTENLGKNPSIASPTDLNISNISSFDEIRDIADGAYNIDASILPSAPFYGDYLTKTYLEHFPFIGKNVSREAIENGTVEDNKELPNGANYFRDNFYLPAFEATFAVNDIIFEEAVANNKPLTIDIFHDPAKVYQVPEKALQEKSRKYLNWWLDGKINGIESDGFRKLCESVLDLDIKRINSMLELGFSIDEIANRAFTEKFERDDAYSNYKIDVFYIDPIVNMLNDGLIQKYHPEEIKDYCTQDQGGRLRVNRLPHSAKPYGRIVDTFSTFDRNLIFYYLAVTLKTKMPYYVTEIIFKEGSKYDYLWKQGGIDNSSDTLYVGPKR